MRIYLDCYPCFMRQALSAARRSNASEEQQYLVMKQALSYLRDIPSNATPPDIAYRIHQLVREAITVDDPYKTAKEYSTKIALDLYPRLKEIVRDSDNPLDTAIRISIAGNIIDFGFKEDIDDLWLTVQDLLHKPYAINHTKQLYRRLEQSEEVLFLADNAGETVFDRVLIEELSIPVTYVVKGGPILNDATIEDAQAAGMDRCASIITNGSQAPGTIISLCSDDFIKRYQSSTLIIAKGQANYETLSEAGEKVFCLLQVKCPVIAADIGVATGNIVVRQSKNFANQN
jgi:damage-control phosphatase, subfamily I